MERSEHQNLDDLLAASRTGEAATVVSFWRRLTPTEQEGVLLQLLAAQAEAGSEAVESGGPSEIPIDDLDDTAAMRPVEETELVPKMVGDLQGLTASERDDVTAAQGPAIVPSEWTDYWSRWRRRWKVSALVAAWVVTTVFAFTAGTSGFGPTEWVVALFGTVVVGGALVGTLLNFAVAALTTRAPKP